MNEELEETQAGRKPYASPALVQHGSVEQLTQAGDRLGLGPAGGSIDADDTAP